MSVNLLNIIQGDKCVPDWKSTTVVTSQEIIDQLSPTL